MSGDTTLQALKRQTFLRDRTDAKNGTVIAGQDYDDVYFIGGSAANLVLTNATINGLKYNSTLRVITSSGDVAVLSTDNVIIVNKTVGATTAVNLPSSPSTNQYFVVKDGKGDANTNNITINGNGKTIDGGSSLIIGSPYGWNQLIYNGTEWNIIG
jgi:hypothetical protein